MHTPELPCEQILYGLAGLSSVLDSLHLLIYRTTVVPWLKCWARGVITESVASYMVGVDEQKCSIPDRPRLTSLIQETKNKQREHRRDISSYICTTLHEACNNENQHEFTYSRRVLVARSLPFYPTIGSLYVFTTPISPHEYRHDTVRLLVFGEAGCIAGGFASLGLLRCFGDRWKRDGTGRDGNEGGREQV